MTCERVRLDEASPATTRARAASSGAGALHLGAAKIARSPRSGHRSADRAAHSRRIDARSGSRVLAPARPAPPAKEAFVVDAPSASPTSSLDQQEAGCITPVTTTKAASGVDIASLRVGVQVTICGITRSRAVTELWRSARAVLSRHQDGRRASPGSCAIVAATWRAVHEVRSGQPAAGELERWPWRLCA